MTASSLKLAALYRGLLMAILKTYIPTVHDIHTYAYPATLNQYIETWTADGLETTNYAKEGDLILDTHLGSGSSRIAAYKGGFNFVGFEIDPEYYEKQEKRFNDFKSQLRLF